MQWSQSDPNAITGNSPSLREHGVDLWFPFHFNDGKIPFLQNGPYKNEVARRESARPTTSFFDTSLLHHTMVIAFLAHRFAPSSRGLQRVEKKSDNGFGIVRRRKNEGLNDVNDEYHSMDRAVEDDDAIVKDATHPWFRNQVVASTGHRRKPFRAMAFLTSVAADLDVIADWVFYHETLKNDREYRREWENQGNNPGNPYLIPPILLNLTLLSCIIGTIMWIILATDGKIAAPLLRRLGIDKLSIGITLFLCVVLEDIPQVILTFLIEDYYEEEHMSTIAICNVMASLYDTLIKLAEAIDERNDMVETGAWCKHSISNAHSDKVSAIVTLLPQQFQDSERMEAFAENTSHHFAPTQMKSTRTLTTTPLPSLRFLSASWDGSMRLWTSRSRVDALGYTIHDTICRSTFASPSSTADRSGVTSLALLGEMTSSSSSSRRQVKPHISNSNSSHFLSGHQNGTVRLWHIEHNEEPLREFHASSHASCAIGIAVVKVGQLFVVIYQDAASCLWDAWSGALLARYQGHNATIRAVCAMGDAQQFVTGSDDRTLRLWNIQRSALPNMEPSLRRTEAHSPCPNETKIANLSLSPRPSDEQSTTSSQIPATEYVESVAVEVYKGHSDAILATACMECGTMFVSGSMDGTARLWEISSGVCLQIFSGHSAGVSSVATIDEVTLLTGSIDTTLKVWDALRGVCLRTYWGHTGIVTGISVTDDDTTFVTSSADCSINIWVLTAIPTENEPNRTLDSILAENDGCCRGYDPE
jgi:WD40 repeat protein